MESDQFRFCSMCKVYTVGNNEEKYFVFSYLLFWKTERFGLDFLFLIYVKLSATSMIKALLMNFTHVRSLQDKNTAKQSQLSLIIRN